MSFLTKSMIHLSNATQAALIPGNNSLAKKLYAFLKKMLEKDEHGQMLSREMQLLNQDVVYFVLNGTDIRNNERAFVAGMNHTNFDERVISKQLLSGTIFENKRPRNENASKTLLFSTNPDLRWSKEYEKYVNDSWNLLWEEYLKLTTRENENHRFTINHWLLNKSKNPLNIGFYWGQQDQHIPGLEDSYFKLSAQTLDELAVAAAINSGLNTLQLPETPPVCGYKLNSLLPVQAHMSQMDQDDEKYNTLENSAFAIYHIIRSYGCWGGNSFYSIPINYGSSKDKVIGILSICTTRPLNEQMIERWSLVANKAFKDIILSDIALIKESERKNQLAESTYGIGHLIINMIKEVETPMFGIRNYLDRITIMDETLHRITRKTDEMRLGIVKLKEISKILHILARTMREKDARIFERKGWHTTTSLDLKVMIVRLENTIIEGRTCFIDIDQNLEIIRLDPFIGDNKILPGSFIYQNILLEILINCMKHYNPLERDRKMSIRFENEKLIFRNMTQPGTISEWTKVSEDNSGGAILYFAFLLRGTNIGDIYRQRIQDDNGYFFETGLELRGLQIKQTE